MKKYIVVIIIVIALAAAAAWGPIMSNVEQAKYTVAESHGDIEIRDYASMIVAETTVSGERKAAINDGFRKIADYIFGNNTSRAEVAMTAPVIQQQPEKIAMTAPVLQSGEGDTWTVRFVMPAEYNMETLPAPNSDAVTLTPLPAKRFAVIRFSGMADDDLLAQQTDKLMQFINDKKLTAISAPAYAFFNPPLTLPFLRRNEIMVEITG